MENAGRACCWGAMLLGDDPDATACTPGFVMGKRHFKSKFCPVHKREMWIPADRVRALPDKLASKLRNDRSGGVWNVMRLPMDNGTVRYRVANNTAGCILPRLVVFEEAPPAHLPWEPLPPNLVIDNDCVQFSVSRGTVVPTLIEGTGHGARCTRIAPTPPASPRSSSPPASPRSSSPPTSPSRPPTPELEALFPEPPTPAMVLVPSVLVKLKSEPPQREAVPALCSTDSDSPPPYEMTAEEKAARRMARNRASAATSRERKRKYIEELEQQVGQLEWQVYALYEENRLWQSLELPPLDDGTFFDTVCESYSPSS